MRHEVGHLTSEGEYFHRLDAELIEKLRRSADLKQQRLRMIEAAHISDPPIIEALEKLGFNLTTVVLFHFVPLVQVAWVDGWVSHAERNHVLALASMHGVPADTPAYERLATWLDQRPAAEFFHGTLRAIAADLASLPAEERHRAVESLIGFCMDIASASGTAFHKICSAERKLLDEIARELEPNRHMGVSAGAAGR